MSQPLSKTTSAPLVTVRIRPTGPQCPIGFPPGTEPELSFTLVPGGCLWLDGPSGRGKTTIARSMVPELCHQQTKVLQKLQLSVQCEWYPSRPTTTPPPLPPSVGILFQQTTLIDELTVAGNLALAIQCDKKKKRRCSTNDHSSSTITGSVQSQMKSVMEMVGLNYHSDIDKRCYELSGGMARRVSLAIQLLQHQNMIVLDEPFTGLDRPTAISIAKELVRLRQPPHNITLVLITHEPELARIVLHENHPNNYGITAGNIIVSLPEPKLPMDDISSRQTQKYPPPHINTTGIQMYDRFVHKLYDYIIYSIPLIICTFVATGMAISMISADALQRLSIQEPIQQLIDTEVRPLITMITGESNVNPLYMIGIKMKVRQLLQTTIPAAKTNIYAIGMIKLFVLEIGPLLTALLLAGRIGGSYSGNVVTMITTSQIHLLRTMGISTNVWLFYPTLCAAWIAGPILTIMGTSVALLLTGYVGVRYQLLSSMYDFCIQVQTTILPTMRLKGMTQQEPTAATTTTATITTTIKNIFELDSYRTTYSPNNWYDTMIEVITYPFLFAIIKSIVFITIIICTAEGCTKYYNSYNYYYHYNSIGTRNRQHHALTHRDVPHVITTSVVVASLAIILADWGFSRLWLQRH